MYTLSFTAWAKCGAAYTNNDPPCPSHVRIIRTWTANELQAEFERKKALAAKPEKLEEAVEKLVRWRIESEKVYYASLHLGASIHMMCEKLMLGPK